MDTKNEEIMVSVICMCYNHEKYIKDALESFVNQKTSFKYEVFVHDDASTDNSARIIREYEKKYPEIIKPIYQTENQHSQGVKSLRRIFCPRCRESIWHFAKVTITGLVKTNCKSRSTF